MGPANLPRAMSLPVTLRVTTLCRGGIVAGMKLPVTLAWLVDEASPVDSGDRFLAALGARLIGDGLPLAGGALTLAAPHPMIASRTWLWRGGGGAGVEAAGVGGFGGGGAAAHGGVRPL